MPSGNGRRPVMADVARLAGVSHQTVSRVLNRHPNVSPDTRARVRAAIDQLGYYRNSPARALASRRTRILGVVAFDPTLYGPASTLFGIERAAREAGYFVSIVNLKQLTPANVREALNYLAEQSVDGLVVIAPKREAVEALAELPRHHPLVVVEGGAAAGATTVSVDQVGGATEATRHLLDLGHSTVWHVAGPPDWLEAEARLEGWRAELGKAGIEPPEPVYGDWSPRSGYLAGRRLARSRGVSAVFVANDQMAMGLLRAFNEAGVRVPQDISVVGFDDMPESAFLTPPLTTVWQNFTEVGHRSIQLLLDRLDGATDGAAEKAVVPAHLRVRASTAAP